MLNIVEFSLVSLQEMGMCWCSDHLQRAQARELPMGDGVARLEQEEVVLSVMAQQVFRLM
jgi:hypothetical protein